METLFASRQLPKKVKWMLVSLLAFAVILISPQQNAAAGQVPVNLRSAGSFAVLAATTITTTSGTTINGNVGLSPGSEFVKPAGVIVNGDIHLADPIASQAQGDLTTAYNNAAGRTTGVISQGPELGGLTLAPGLYKSTNGFAITSTNLTLDANGDADAVWIFQMASTLNVGNGRQVILAGGAQAGNVFWQVGSSATLGTTVIFKGNILAFNAISINTGATLDGRALASNAAVTLDANILTRPLLGTPDECTFYPIKAINESVVVFCL